MTLEQKIEEIPEAENQILEEISNSSEPTLAQQITHYNTTLEHYKSQIEQVEKLTKQYVKQFKKSEKYARKKTKKEVKMLRKLNKQFAANGLDKEKVSKLSNQLDESQKAHQIDYFKSKNPEIAKEIEKQGLHQPRFILHQPSVMLEVIMNQLNIKEDVHQKAMRDYVDTTIRYHTQPKQKRFRYGPFKTLAKRWKYHADPVLPLTVLAALIGGTSVGVIAASPLIGLMGAGVGVIAYNAADVGHSMHKSYRNPPPPLTKKEFKQKKNNTLNQLMNYKLGK